MKAWAVTKPDGSRLSPSSYNPSTVSTLIETVTLNHPVAYAGGDRTAGTAEQCGVSLAGTATDADPVALQYRWVEGATELSPWAPVGPDGGAPLGVCGLPIGRHALALEVTDGKTTASDAMTLTVADTTAPSLTARASRTVLWSPDHGMVAVTIETRASDNDGAPPALAASVSSNEPQDGLGDGDTAGDWTEPVIDAAGRVAVQLRAERSGGGSGREYAISLTATDSAGNVTTVPVTVRVPHSM
jgi:hypothetical protein